jgi:hypothetical protein
MSDERCVRSKVRAPRQLCLFGWSQQVERQVDARPCAGDIVLEIGVQPLVS